MKRDFALVKHGHTLDDLDDIVITSAVDHNLIEFDGTNWVNISRSSIFANPSASIGLTAVNGTAITAMRSDGAPALSQSITPTWTADHIFTQDVEIDGHLHLGAEEVMVVNGGTIHGQLEINSDTAAIQEIHTHSATNNSVAYFARARGTTALPTIVQSGDYLGAIYAAGYDGTDYALGAGIQFLVSATPGSNDMPADILFLTSADGTQSPTERFRVKADGTSVFSGTVTGTSFNTFTGFANPSASVGLSAVNGSAATAMRSDGAPALSQAIDPTWTGKHLFTGDMADSTAVGVLVGERSGRPGFELVDSAAAADQKTWEVISINSSQFSVRAINDAFSTARNALLFTKSGVALTSLAFGNATDNQTFSFLGTGSGSVAGSWLFTKSGTEANAAIQLSAAAPSIRITETDAAADEGQWRLVAISGLLRLDAVDDASSAAKVAWSINRNGTAVDSMKFGNATDNPTFDFIGTGEVTINSHLTITSASNPGIDYVRTGSGADLKVWRFDGFGTSLRGMTRSDDLSAGNNWLLVTRGATTAVADIALGNATNNNTFSFLGSGTTTHSGSVAIAADNQQFSVGASADFTILHDGTDTILDNNTGLLKLLGATSGQIIVNTTGALYGTALHNNGGAVTGATNQYVVSGTYTPGLTNVTNVAASTARKCQWMRVGNVVTVSGQVDIDPTGAGATELGIALPIASALTTAFQLGGTANSNVAAGEEAMIDADAANDRARVRFVAVNLTNHTYAFIFAYEVL